MDMGKYREVFLEEAAENLAEMSRALLELEKDPAHAESIDLLFRMAHSIKGMAASLGYTSITDVSHRFEDRMQLLRSGQIHLDTSEFAHLFRALDALEGMIDSVRRTGMAPTDAAITVGSPPAEAPWEGLQKKA